MICIVSTNESPPNSSFAFECMVHVLTKETMQMSNQHTASDPFQTENKNGIRKHQITPK